MQVICNTITSEYIYTVAIHEKSSVSIFKIDIKNMHNQFHSIKEMYNKSNMNPCFMVTPSSKTGSNTIAETNPHFKTDNPYKSLSANITLPDISQTLNISLNWYK